MSDQLPSIDNLPESELPSVDQFITEEQELPSIEEFVEKEEEEIVEEVEEEIVAEAQDLTEVLRLISDVRKDIPDIPEIKYYDEELERHIHGHVQTHVHREWPLAIDNGQSTIYNRYYKNQHS